jgi:hypothetical protein
MSDCRSVLGLNISRPREGDVYENIFQKRMFLGSTGQQGINVEWNFNRSIEAIQTFRSHEQVSRWSNYRHDLTVDSSS